MFGKNSNKKKTNLNPNEIRTLIGEGCVFEGNIKSPYSTRIDGNVKGKVDGDSNLIIGEKGVIIGEVQALEIIVYGKIEGDVESEKIEIKKGGSIIGDMICLQSP
jgi:cytoskeletal protein CcmA (bactofilin family)